MTDSTIVLGVTSIANDLRLPRQARIILSHLLKRGHITNQTSMIQYHIHRLSDCILKIRRAGYDVETEVRRDDLGAKYADYRLAKKLKH